MSYKLEGYVFRNGKNVEGLDDDISLVKEMAENLVDSLEFSELIPVRDEDGYEEWTGISRLYTLPKHWFPEVTWETGPQKVTLTITKKE